MKADGVGMCRSRPGGPWRRAFQAEGTACAEAGAPRKHSKGAGATGAGTAEGQWEARAEVGQELDTRTWRPQR